MTRDLAPRRVEREIPFWTLPPVFAVIVLAVVLFPFRLVYERVTGRS